MRTKPGFIFKLLMLAILITRPAMSGITVTDKITADYQAGKINYLTFLQYRAYLRADPSQLPIIYQGFENTEIRSATPLLLELKQNWPAFSLEFQSLIAPLFKRPILSLSIISPSKRFRLHYALDGENATTELFVQQTAAAFDSAYNFQVLGLGFPAPPGDFGIEGDELDIYIVNMPSSYYAETVPENPITTTDRDDYSSWIRLDNDFAGYYTSGLDGMRVTSAHEFFHMIHIGIRWSLPESQLGYNELFFYEISGVWMEDMMYDHINDYLAYLPNFFNRPTYSFFYYGSNNYAYAQSIWNHYLTKRFGLQTVRDIWLEMMTLDVLTAMESVLQKRNSSFKKALMEYYGWNAITANRADTITYYPDGDLYPRIKPTDSLDVYSAFEKKYSNNLLSAKYLLFKIQVPGNYTATVNFEDPDNGQFACVIFHSDGTIELSSNNQRSRHLGYLMDATEIYLIPVNLQMPSSKMTSNNHPYTVRLELTGADGIQSKITNIFPNPFYPDQEKKIKIEFLLEKVAEDVRVFIFTENGLLIRELNLGSTGQRDNFYWDGKNYYGQLAASGIYLVQIVANEPLKPGKIAVIRGQ